jgi:hypothetical protein
MVSEMFVKFGISAFHSRLTLSSIIASFCKFHTFPFNKSTTVTLQYFRERFPFDCCCLFKILGAVLNWSTDNEHRKEVNIRLNFEILITYVRQGIFLIWFSLSKVLQLIKNLKYSVKRDACRLRSLELNKYVLEHEFMPLKCIPHICIPHGTAVVPDFEEDIITFQKSLPIWDVMRNYLTMYLNGDVSKYVFVKSFHRICLLFINNFEQVDNSLMYTAVEIINFVDVSLQKMKTINDDILQFSELVVHVIWK